MEVSSTTNSINDMTTKITSLTYLEFYSGIGGWGYALEHACRSINNKNKNDDGSILLQPQLLAAYDHSDLCNTVLLHNHQFPNISSSSIPANNKKRKKQQSLTSQTPIEKITLETLSSFNANIWCMSPPWKVRLVLFYLVWIQVFYMKFQLFGYFIWIQYSPIWLPL